MINTFIKITKGPVKSRKFDKKTSNDQDFHKDYESTNDQQFHKGYESTG